MKKSGNEPATSEGSTSGAVPSQPQEKLKDENAPETPSLFNDAEIKEKILTDMRQAKSPVQLKESCDKYRAEYNKFSKESQALILKEKKDLLARFKQQNKAASPAFLFVVRLIAKTNVNNRISGPVGHCHPAGPSLFQY